MRRNAAAVGVVLVLVVLGSSVTHSHSQSGATPGTPAAIPTCGWRSPGPCSLPDGTIVGGPDTVSFPPITPGAYPTCSGSVPDSGGCVRVIDAGTPILLFGPPTESIIAPEHARQTQTAAAVMATCAPYQQTGCVQTAAGVLRKHWTATAAAGGVESPGDLASTTQALLAHEPTPTQFP